MVNPDQIQVSFACGLVRRQQILRPQFVTRGLRAGERVFERQSHPYLLVVTVDDADHRSAALVRICLAGVFHHHSPRFLFDPDHSSSQKCSLRYFSALSHNTVTIVAVSPRSATSRASLVAACTLQPEEMPTSSPSSRASRRTMA